MGSYSEFVINVGCTFLGLLLAMMGAYGCIILVRMMIDLMRNWDKLYPPMDGDPLTASPPASPPPPSPRPSRGTP
jgi:hypothetical protein